jgi:hypothetical protein
LNYAQIVTDAFGYAIGDSLVPNQRAPNANDLQPVQVTAQRIPVDTADGASASAQLSPLTENLDTASFYQPNVQALVDSIPPPPITIAVGTEGAQGYWGVAQSLLGPNASNSDIQTLALQLITANPDTPTLHVGDALTLGDGSISPQAAQTYGDLDARYQAHLAAKQAQLGAQQSAPALATAFGPDAIVPNSSTPEPDSGATPVIGGRSAWDMASAIAGAPNLPRIADALAPLENFINGFHAFSDLKTNVVASAGLGLAATANVSTQRLTGGDAADTVTVTPMVGEGAFIGPAVDFSLIGYGEVAPLHYAASAELAAIAGVSLNLTFDQSGNFDLRLGGQVGFGEFAGVRVGTVKPQAGAEYQFTINEQSKTHQ